MKGLLLRALGSLVLHEGIVRSVRAEPPFLEVELDAPSLRAARPGDKIQVLLPDDVVRTYTPIPGDPPRLLVYLHGDTPGPRWARALRVGDRVRFKGPDRSLDLPPGDRVLIGDETSVAVARAYAGALALIETPHALPGVRTFARGDYAGIAAAVPEGAVVGLTGGAPLVVGVRAELRRRGVSASVKTYWAPVRKGLD